MVVFGAAAGQNAWLRCSSLINFTLSAAPCDLLCNTPGKFEVDEIRAALWSGPGEAFFSIIRLSCVFNRIFELTLHHVTVAHQLHTRYCTPFGR